MAMGRFRRAGLPGLLALWLAVPLGMTPTAGLAQADLGVLSFVAGANSTEISGTIAGDGYASVFIDAAAGQVLSVSLASPSASVNFNVLPEGNPEAIYIGSIYGPDYVGRIAEAGRYEIRVYQLGAASSEGREASFSLAIGLNAVTLPEQEDALVEGTDFHATGALTCRFEASPDASDCAFGVRRLGGGTASLFITLPSGFVRQLDFASDGAVTAPSAALALSATRDGDETIVTLGADAEIYTVPDVVISGD
ncbi:hypothetical protein SAMN02983003_2139 [Devosia enhydra]|uniref:Uncharacterized protein n=1 Tax=Devosia enhydra TaxID=665118 RepID=A0A1K2HXW6_9HYPH|nr:hypothetical protein [Devosia enhydra]SFZ84655.1 hypothetical protein SAMN02983003_2139 [Devosia enhydra]